MQLSLIIHVLQNICTAYNKQKMIGALIAPVIHNPSNDTTTNFNLTDPFNILLPWQ